MSNKPDFTRSDFVRQRGVARRTAQTSQTVSSRSGRRLYEARSVYLPGSLRQVSHGRARSYDIAFTLGRTRMRAPGLEWPLIDWSNSRLVSGFLSVVLVAALFLLWNASLFRVTSAEVLGNQRLSVADINAVLGVIDQPIFKAVPAVIENNLRLAYPELQSVQVQVRFPNRILVTVAERTPVLAWYQNGSLTWVDAQGFAFQPRGNVPGLVQVTANGALQVPHDPNLPPYEQRLLLPSLVKGVLEVAPYAPEGIPLLYDPKYGIGWQDPRGWTVYFGNNAEEMAQKLVVYEALVQHLLQNGEQPSVISMKYLDAPVYR